MAAACGVVLGAGFTLGAHAELQLDACADALHKGHSRVSCNAVYRTTTPAELELLAKLSYGLVRKSSCDMVINFDIAALAAQYRTESQLRPEAVHMNCVMETPAAQMPIKVVASTRVGIGTDGTAESFVTDAIEVTGFSDAYEGQILRFLNTNGDLKKDVIRMLNEHVRLFAGHKGAESRQKPAGSFNEKSGPKLAQ